jgi:predicted O-methyltransferase YrrM
MNWDQLFDKPGPCKDYADDARGPIGRADAVLLGAICNYLRPKIVVEYGSLDGHSAAVFARFAEVVYCVEADTIRPGLHHVAGDHPNVRVFRARMQDFEPAPGDKVDLLYVDASHDYQDSMEAYRRIEKYLEPTALIVCHDTAQWEDPDMWGAEFRPVREAAMNGERDFVEWLKVVHGWNPVAFGAPKGALRHGLTILQKSTGW